MVYEVGLVDDHQLVLKAFSLMLKTFPQFNVTLEATDAAELKKKITELNRTPDIFLIDVNLPDVDGIEIADWLTKNYPEIKLAALSMTETHRTIVAMMHAGCCSYLLKNAHPDDLEKALLHIAEKGYYNADITNFNYQRIVEYNKEEASISERERVFLPFVCTDLTYKEIAVRMGVSERTIDGYRESLFFKLNVQSRTGLAMEAVRRKLVKL